MSDGSQDAVGSVGEEAAKLLGALQGWARESGSEYAGAASDAAGGASATWDSINEHLATGGDDCRYCPLCHVISAARELSPEVKQHLAQAASSMLQAATSFVAHQGQRRGGSRGTSSVEKIDLSDDDGWEED